ncbi:DNA recombination protein RmuC [Gulosibacter sp. 10]|uniref:DNA recombination protein RmuC n=1 Tax=Gulosibacter sp. 10 TaxID=1255570 RepID=UPI00097F667B|nr:DNA recombination protein RmuC [Gulosibacter sp. 10]SJM66688.1 DNA recombination protein RmuC [Gulosibacter sp. 10]
MEMLWILLALLIGLAIGALGARILFAAKLAAAAAQASGAEARAEELRAQLESGQQQRSDEQRVLLELAPMRAELERMRRTVQEFEQERNELSGRLSEQLRRQAQADVELRASTEQLAAALRSNTERGSWGEAQLRNLLESAGMLEHVDFDLQRSFANDEAVARPDAVVHLPGEHALVIDSKAPMNRYLEAMRLPHPGDEETEQRRRSLLHEHARVVRGHVDALRARDYPAAVPGSPRLVVAYLPSESALSAAISADPGLLDYAFGRDVALASPVTLWAILRAVAAAWQQERVSESVAEVLSLSSDLYRRIGTAAGHLAKLGKQLHGSVTAYDSLVGSFETRVFPTARKLGEYDAAAKPHVRPQPIEKTPRPLTAPEFTSEPAD